MKTKITHEIQCSRCGKRETVSLNPYSEKSILKVAHEWCATGVLYCPKCKQEISTYSTDYEFVLAAILSWILG